MPAAALPREVIRTIRRIEIRTRRLVNESLVGSPGTELEFAL